MSEEIDMKESVADTFLLLKEDAMAAKEQYRKKFATEDSAYWAGFLAAYHDVISLLQSQAQAFDLSLSALALDDIQPEVELLSLRQEDPPPSS